jgi:hypothetical protein
VPRALVLTTASKANTTGGTFADSLTANSGDSLSVANYGTGGARIIEAWGIDSDSVAELQLIYTRPESTHDQSHGLRVQIPSLTPGGAGLVAAHNLLPGYVYVDVFKSDTPTVQVTSTAGDDVVLSYNTLYDDLPGAAAQLTDWNTILGMRKSVTGISVAAQASATAGLYGATRALNADDDRLHANTNYAILGYSVRTQVTTVSIKGPGWGGQRIGCPCGALDLRSDTWFLDQSLKYGVPLIPWFNSNDKGNILLEVVDAEASTTPNIDVMLVELSGQPGPTT